MLASAKDTARVVGLVIGTANGTVVLRSGTLIYLVGLVGQYLLQQRGVLLQQPGVAVQPLFQSSRLPPRLQHQLLQQIVVAGDAFS